MKLDLQANLNITSLAATKNLLWKLFSPPGEIDKFPYIIFST